MRKCLSNGAEILESRPYPFWEGCRIVLARTQSGEYVTWNVDQNGDATSGHYFDSNLAAALADYQHR